MLYQFRNTFAWLAVALYMLPFTASASEPVTLDEVLALKEEPDGVVIEIVTGTSDALKWALPESQGYIAELKKRFPDMPIAIVTHGREQFALTKKNQAKNKKVHSLTQALKKEGIQLHVCGTYAGWEGLTDEDFPEYVDVSAAGPAQINDYKAVGFLHLIIDENN
jgi:intracellular sulfur oxidation DsrE/DsrF family protein